MNRLLAHLHPFIERQIENSEPNLSPAEIPDAIDCQRIAELTIAELTITVASQRAELANAYREIVNQEQLLQDLEASYGRESTSPQGENEDGI